MRFLNEQLKPIFQQYNAVERFGITVLHEPFEVKVSAPGSREGELKRGYKLVNFGNIAYPANTAELTQETRARLVPTTYFLTKISTYSMPSSMFWSKTVCKTCSASRPSIPAFLWSDSNAGPTSLPSPSSLKLSFLGRKAFPRSTFSLLTRTQSYYV